MISKKFLDILSASNEEKSEEVVKEEKEEKE